MKRVYPIARCSQGHEVTEALSRDCHECATRRAHRRYKRSAHGKERLRRYREANRAKVSAYGKAWARANPEKKAWGVYQRHARKRGIEILIDRPLFADLVTDNCFYCGASPGPLNGIDRVDNAKGYAEDNVVTACRMCNVAKNDRSREQFEAWAIRVAARVQVAE